MTSEVSAGPPRVSGTILRTRGLRQTRPLSTADKPISVNYLIEDVWRAFECPVGTPGCTVEFDDPDFLGSGRDALYYVRAVEAPIEMVNAGTLRVERDSGGDFVSMDPCSGKPKDDDCLAPQHPMAWSSPIFVAHRPVTHGIEVGRERLRR